MKIGKNFLNQTALKMGPFEEHVRRTYNGIGQITRADLLGDHSDLKRKLSGITVNVTKEFVVKLELFRVKENETSQFTRDLLQCFYFEFQCSVKQAKKAVDNVVNEYSNLQKSKNKNTAKKILFENVCSEPFTILTGAYPVPLLAVPGEIPCVTKTDTQPVLEQAERGNLQVQNQEWSSSQVFANVRAAHLGTELWVVRGKLGDVEKVNEEY
jgi:hypothetical protein